MLKIIIVDDHELIREGLKKILSAHNDLMIAGEARSIGEAIQLTETTAPDVILLDISLPDQEQLTGLMEIHRRFPQIPVLVLSIHPEERFAIPALKEGAAGYINKSMAAEEIPNGIRCIAAGKTYINARVAELLAANVRSTASSSWTGQDVLTTREKQVIAMLGAGKQTKQIASELSISVSSVNTYRARIFKKTGMNSNAALIRYAVEHGLVA